MTTNLLSTPNGMTLDELKESAAREAIALGLTELVKRTNADRREQAKA